MPVGTDMQCGPSTESDTIPVVVRNDNQMIIVQNAVDVSLLAKLVRLFLRRISYCRL